MFDTTLPDFQSNLGCARDLDFLLDCGTLHLAGPAEEDLKDHSARQKRLIPPSPSRRADFSQEERR